MLLTSFGGMCNTLPTESPVVDLGIFFSTGNNDFKTLVLPIRRVQNLIVVEARINDIVGNFILDTGCPLLVLNKTYFRKGYEIQDRTEVSAAGGESAPVYRTKVNNLNIRELYFEKIAADLSDLGHIENQRGIKILGLLGVGLFTSFEMVIDLHKSVVYLHRLDANGNVPESERVVHTEEILNIPIVLMRNIITVNATVAGKTLTLCIDTGAETNALSNLVSSKILSGFNVSKRMLMLGTGGARTEVLLGTLDEMTIGSKTFKNTHTIITKLENLGDAYGRSIDGILGNNFLVKGIISINFVKNELRMNAFDVVKPKDNE
jgi:predicted aspartyl protease